MAFKVGDRVAWTSGAGGGIRDKVGVVIEIVPANEPPRARVNSPGRPRPHQSYVVRGIAQGTETEHKRIYWPRVHQLKLQPEGAS